MGLSYWSTGNPDNRLLNTLYSDFREDMRNIQFGYTYKDPGTSVMAPDKRGYPHNIFSYFSMKTCCGYSLTVP